MTESLSEVEALRADLERARYERDEEQASRIEAQRSCEKAIRERRSLEIKEDEWHRAYERSESRLRTAETALLELVWLHDGPRDADYKRRKPLAWAAARVVVSADPPETT